MRLHWKLLILLMTIALLPLAVSTWQWNQGARKVRANLSEWIGEQATERVINRLKEVIAFSTENLTREMELVETALKVQALSAERALKANPPQRLERPYLDSDYDRGYLPPGMVTSERHLRLSRDGGTTPMSVSYAEQVFRLPKGRTFYEYAKDISRLSGLLPVYRELGQVYGDLFFWQYTALENGLHAAYPGHGGYPENYDPRQRDWYKKARAQGKLVWGDLLVDASTGQLISTASMPVFGPRGGFAGVTAIDIEIVGTLRKLGRRINMVNNVEAFLVRFTKDGVRVVAHPNYAVEPRFWADPIAISTLPDEVAGRFSVSAQGLSSGKTGMLRMPVDGIDTVWTFGHLETFGLYLVLAVPFEDISNLADLAEEIISDETAGQLRLTALMSVLLIFSILGAAFFGSRTVTEPLRELAAVARKVARGDLSDTVPVSSRDEIGDLARIFNRMIPRLRERLALRQSLALAKEVQQHLLPKEPPNIPGLDIAALSIYCDQTGGDYYDFLPAPEGDQNSIVLVVADITGHGASAALLMASFRAALRARLGQLSEAGVGLDALNRQMAEDAQGGRFVTFLGLYIDLKGRTTHRLCAGHAPALVYDPAAKSFEEWGGEDIPIGVDPGWTYTIQESPLPDREVIFALGTDGIWECRNAEGEMFGRDRLEALIAANAGKPSAGICEAVRSALSEFRGGRVQEDDITLIIAKSTLQR